MYENLILCLADNCPYETSCARKCRDDPDEVNDTYYDFSWYCNIDSGFDSYIKRIIERAN